MKYCIETAMPRPFREEELLFSFTHEGKRYAVLPTADREACSCGIALWDAWNGWHTNDDPPTPAALTVGDRILYLAEREPATFPLKGEHYEALTEIEGNVTRLQLNCRRRSRGQRWRSRCMNHAPLISRLLLQLALAFSFYGFLADLSHEWFRFLFPEVASKSAALIITVAQLTLSALLFALCCKRRWPLDLVANAIIPVGLIPLAGILMLNPVFFISLPFSLILGYLLGSWVDASPPTYPKRPRRREMIASGGRWALLFTVLLCILLLKVFSVVPYTEPRGWEDFPPERIEEIKSDYEKACKLLPQHMFSELSEEERQDVLRDICAYECAVTLGVVPPALQFLPLEDEFTNGHYSSPTRTITINSRLLEENESYILLNVLLHEVRHHWQHCVVNLQIKLAPHMSEDDLRLSFFRDALIFKENFQNYLGPDNPGVEWEDYANQPVEKDSQNWSEDRFYDYYWDRIYLSYP